MNILISNFSSMPWFLTLKLEDVLNVICDYCCILFVILLDTKGLRSLCFRWKDLWTAKKVYLCLRKLLRGSLFEVSLGQA